MQETLTYAQIILAVLMIAAILLQQKSVGMGSAMGGASAAGGENFAAHRGVDRLLGHATVVLAVLFFGTAIAYLFV